ncbi:MAG: hypothetical protein O8C66_05845 [Candidatus Methanoperedens sp.]|nr:hypothetical protein [Candidatus Methanoperedens sp.]MCZ7370012.1 hypothetical protein [Candidatus Methanoperedens sp.]
MFKWNKEYFIKSAAIVLFIIIAGCVSTQPHATPVPPQEKLPNKTLRPISVVSVEPGCARFGDNGCYPAGPAFTLTLNASSTNMPVTHLSATLILIKEVEPTFQIPVEFTFPYISQSNPLMPGQNASETSGAIVGPVDVLNTNGTTTVLIEGTLQNGQSFSYWTNETSS